jgi:putative DNA primase/helicase
MSDFAAFARACGVEINDLYASQHIKRCGTTLHPKSKNGAYFFDGERGWVQAWDGDAQINWFGSDRKPWTDADKREWAVKRKAMEAQTQQRREDAAKRAQELLNTATKATHDYLTRKGFDQELGFVGADGELIIPMRELTGELLGAQIIKWDHVERTFTKKMLPGMRAKAAVFRMGPKVASETFLCEGYATGLSIRDALAIGRSGAAVLVCFSASNMALVAGQVKGKRFVCADNDKSGVGEKTAKETGLPYCMSPTIGQDLNDLHASAGLFAVANLLMQVRRR